MAYALEDEFGDILQKARDGLAWSQKDLASETGLPVADIARMERYDLIPSDEVMGTLARALRLDADCLVAIAHERWEPKPVADDSSFILECMEVFMGTYPVKCYLAACPQTKEAAVIDTGANPETIIERARALDLQVKRILLTHNHPDHAWGLDKLDRAFNCPAWIGPNENRPRGSRDLRFVKDGEILKVGSLDIEVMSTPGHTADGMSYRIHRTIFSGDCLFAGSMGRANASWQGLYDSITRRLLAQPGETVLHPGHGPATTVLEEKDHNPFFCGKVPE